MSLTEKPARSGVCSRCSRPVQGNPGAVDALEKPWASQLLSSKRGQKTRAISEGNTMDGFQNMTWSEDSRLQLAGGWEEQQGSADHTHTQAQAQGRRPQLPHHTSSRDTSVGQGRAGFRGLV